MIKINLLENSKGKNRRGSSGPSMPTMEMGDMGSPKLKILAVLVVAGLLNLGELADVKARFLERQTQANNYKRRVDVIDSLRASQSGGPVNLLAMLGETVNNTEAVWLSRLDDQGPSIALEGTALSTDAVANLIANLQKTGYFRTVEIKETYQDDTIKDMQAFQFMLTCEKAKS